MSDQSRRKLLKSLAAGSGAIIAGKSLPESWSKPIVKSVVLPAHAETSPAVAECPSVCADLTINGFTLTCGDTAIPLEYLLYSLVDDACGCAELRGPVISSSNPSVASNQILIDRQLDAGSGVVSIGVLTPGGSRIAIDSTCPNVSSLSRNTGPTIVSLPSNTTYRVLFSIIGDGINDLIIITDMAISPV